MQVEHGSDADTVMLALLASRRPGATICPSEVARALTSDTSSGAWRDAMPIVHAATDRLLAQGHLRLSWKGEALEARDGPYRIGLS